MVKQKTKKIQRIFVDLKIFGIFKQSEIFELNQKNTRGVYFG